MYVITNIKTTVRNAINTAAQSLHDDLMADEEQAQTVYVRIRHPPSP